MQGAKGVVVGGLALALVSAAAAEDFNARFFGRATSASGVSWACFIRAYDAAHLTAHPAQNVAAMALLAVRDPKNAGAATDARIRVTFRSVRGAFATGGYCGAAQGAIAHCTVPRDVGAIDVRLEAAGTVLVGIPAGGRLWDPRKPDDDGSIKGKFGPDDRVFRLSRAPRADCLALASNDAERSAFRGRPK